MICVVFLCSDNDTIQLLNSEVQRIDSRLAQTLSSFESLFDAYVKVETSQKGKDRFHVRPCSSCHIQTRRFAKSVQRIEDPKFESSMSHFSFIFPLSLPSHWLSSCPCLIWDKMKRFESLPL